MEQFKDVLSKDELERGISAEEVTLLDPFSRQSKGEHTCIITSENVHLVSDDREVVHSVNFCNLSRVYVQPYDGDQLPQMQLQAGVHPPQELKLNVERPGNKGRGGTNLIVFVAHEKRSRISHILDQAYKCYMVRSYSLKNICLPVVSVDKEQREDGDAKQNRKTSSKATPLQQRKGGQIPHPVCRLSQGSYKRLFEKLRGDLVACNNVEQCAELLEQMTVVAGCSSFFSLQCIPVLETCIKILLELQSYVALLLRTDSTWRWRRHKEALQAKRSVMVSTLRVKLKLDRNTKKPAFEFFREERGLKIFFDGGHENIKMGDYIVKVAGRRLAGLDDEAQQAAWEKYKYNGAYLSVERQNDRETMKALNEKANREGELTSFHASALRCCSASFSLLSRVYQASFAAPLRMRKMAIQQSDDGTSSSGIKEILKAVLMGTEMPTGEEVEDDSLRRSTRGLEALQRIRKTLKSSLRGESGVLSGGKKGSVLQQQFKIPNLKALPPLQAKDEKKATRGGPLPDSKQRAATKPTAESLDKAEDQDAFELLIERTCHMQMEAFAAILQMTEDPDIENVIKSNITEVLKGGFDFHQHTERLARILFHTANLTKNAEFTATAGFYLYQYTLGAKALLDASEKGFLKQVAKLSGITIKALSRGFNRIRRARKVLSTSPNLRYYMLSLPLLEALLKKLS